MRRATTTRFHSIAKTSRPAALQQIDLLTASEPRNSGYRNLKAVVLANIGITKSRSRSMPMCSQNTLTNQESG